MENLVKWESGARGESESDKVGLATSIMYLLYHFFIKFVLSYVCYVMYGHKLSC